MSNSISKHPPKIVITPDSFKGSLRSEEVASIIARGAADALRPCTILAFPLADGGEGTVHAILSARRHLASPTPSARDRLISVPVHDPLGRPITARYGLLSDGTAVMEMAEASGLTLIAEPERDVMHSSTYGTGEMMLDAIRRGCRRILIGIGGSATNDGGMGMAAALGVRFLDAAGRELAPVPAHFGEISTIDLSGLPPELQACRESQTLTELQAGQALQDCRELQAGQALQACRESQAGQALQRGESPARISVTVLCDVQNPLLGPEGATTVYGPQKGVTPDLLPVLEQGMAHYIGLVERATGMSLRARPGAGAAGGLGAALVGFARASIVPGIESVLDLAGFDAAIADADLVVTGEGRMDAQSLHGKTTIGVAERCRAAGVPCVAIVGCTGPGYESMLEHGITEVLPIAQDIPASQAFSEAEERCYRTARSFFENWQVRRLSESGTGKDRQ